MDDKVILELVREINGGNYAIELEKNGFEYFKVEPVMLNERPYRLILLLCLTEDYLGVVNAFRVPKGKRYD